MLLTQAARFGLGRDVVVRDGLAGRLVVLGKRFPYGRGSV